MVKGPKNSEVLMYGEEAKPAPRAEIITFDDDGKAKVGQGGLMSEPLPEPEQAKMSEPTPLPAPVDDPPRQTFMAPPSVQSNPPPAPSVAPPVQHAASAKKSKSAKKPAPVASPVAAKTKGKSLAKNTMGSLVSGMREKAMAKGGTLTLQDIDAMEKEIQAKTRQMEVELEAAFDDYAEAVEKQRWNAERSDPFFRLLIKQFSHLFKEPAARKSANRRMIPGFYLAASMLLGPDAIERYQDRCRSVVALLQSDVPDDQWDWEIFYAERDAVTVSLDAQVLIAAQFKDYDKRMRWFIELVNGQLAPPGETASEGERAWTLQEAGARRMLDALLGDLRKVLSSQKGRERLVKRHGPDLVSDAIGTLKRLVTG